MNRKRLEEVLVEQNLLSHQEINVALGGSLHYRIHQLSGKNDHRRPRREDVAQEEVYRLNHMVKLTAGGLFQSLT